jgi:hypothetical protein
MRKFCFKKKCITFAPGFYADKGQTHADKSDMEFKPQIVPFEVEINFKALFDN